MDYDEHLSAAGREASAFEDALRAGPTDATVPSCPAWRVEDLAVHVGHFMGFWAHVLCEGSGRPKPELPAAPPLDALPAWIQQQREALLTELAATPPDTAVWTWNPDETTASFVARRVANELAVHRVDMELARGAAAPIERKLAADGIDELGMIMVHAPGVTTGNGETIHLHATDGDGEWLLTLAGTGFEMRHEHSKGDVALRGTVSDLELTLYGRTTNGPIEQLGYASAVDAWSQIWAWQ